METTKFLNVEEAAKYLGVHKNSLYQLVRRHRIPYYKPGRKLFFDPAELEEYIRAGRVEFNEKQESEVT